MKFLLSLWRSLLRLFFRLLYGPFAWTYDAVAWLVSFGQWTAWGKTVLHYLEGPRVLELAHGPGHLMAAMARKGLQPVGLDLSPQMENLARRRLQRAGLPARLVRARAQAIPFRDGAFSGVAATFPTEFILDPRTVREVARVLTPKGNVAVAAASLLTGRDLLSSLLEWLYRVTGQRGPLPQGNESIWKQAGLTIRTERIDVGRSQVLVVVGQKNG